MGCEVGRPSRIAVASSATSLGVNPSRPARSGSTWKLVAGPEMVLSTPFWVSTTPGIFLMASSTLGPSWLSRAASLEKSLIWMGSGELERSPIMSCRTWVNSMSRAGSDFLILFADVLHDLFDVAVAVLLEADREVSGVGLGDRGEAHLQAGAAAGDLDLGRAAQYLLDVLEDAVGLASEVPAGVR